MQRLLGSVCVFLATAASASAATAIRTQSVPLPVRGDAAYIIRSVPGACALRLYNHGPGAADIATPQSHRLAAGEFVPVDGVTGSDTVAIIEVPEKVDLQDENGSVFTRNRILAEGDHLWVERMSFAGVPFFIANVSPFTLHVEAGCQRIEVPAGQLFELDDLFASCSPDTMSTRIVSTSPGSRYFAGLQVIEASPFQPRRRPARPPVTGDCGTLESQYAALLAEIEKLDPAVTIPDPPSINFSCSGLNAGSAYAEELMNEEASRIATMVGYDRVARLWGCPWNHDLGTDTKRLRDRLVAKEKRLAQITATDKHPAAAAAMLKIERDFTTWGYSTGVDALQIVGTWMRADADRYLKKVKEEHDYTAAVGLIKALNDYEDSGGSLKREELVDVITRLNDALTFRLEMTFEVLTTIAETNALFKMNQEGKATAHGVASDGDGFVTPPILPVPVPILHKGGLTTQVPMQLTLGTLTGEGINCQLSGGAVSVPITLWLDPCGDTPLKMALNSPLGGPCTWMCDNEDDGPVLLPGGYYMMEFLMRIASGSMDKPINFDDKEHHAPHFTNGSPNPVDDTLAINGSLEDWESHALITIKLTHAPR